MTQINMGSCKGCGTKVSQLRTGDNQWMVPGLKPPATEKSTSLNNQGREVYFKLPYYFVRNKNLYIQKNKFQQRHPSVSKDYLFLLVPHQSEISVK